MKDDGGITNNTLRFYGLDSSGEIVLTGFNDVFDLFASKIEVLLIIYFYQLDNLYVGKKLLSGQLLLFSA